MGLATGDQPQIRAHSWPEMVHEPFEPAVVIAMTVTQDKTIDPRWIEIEQIKVADQHLGGV
jgi:hypothetical protein